jgi:hypothetical protein
MDYSQHNAIVNFLWGLAADVLRDLYVRGNYRDVILPMTVKTLKGYEISFTKYFYRYQALRELDAIAADLLKLERETEGLLRRILEPGKPA